jgi:hypothetical protein
MCVLCRLLFVVCCLLFLKGLNLGYQNPKMEGVNRNEDVFQKQQSCEYKVSGIMQIDGES